ncbi:hypothetical protein O7632_31635 [Solwaraspora sp. WMMD406]|uniref:hypothetical protein n=1 Tax=Solwaraspora sp. WMMD406 TaxID=3016095 RepID=UPI002416A9E6|nr:hypothetical protein [Solwaraspora sp. WMMD406]MDG4768609.1 hypothetical protein [Solwaraspora sp. WMMD406]
MNTQGLPGERPDLPEQPERSDTDTAQSSTTAEVGSPEADYQEHDRYFRVVRTRSQPGVTFFKGLRMAHLAVSSNAQENGLSALSFEEFARLSDGLDSLLNYAAHGSQSGIGADQAALPAAPAGPTTPQLLDEVSTTAGERWLVGHQLFFALMQGSIVGLTGFLRASADGRAADARDALGVAAAFMRSSTAAFRFTCDFTPVDYERLIRPAMAPPAVRAGFSGLQTRDHAYLMSLFAEVRVMRSKIGTDIVDSAFEEFVDATVEAYEAHQLICSRFGGDVLPSLRMAARSAGRHSQPGVHVVRQMMRARLFALRGHTTTDHVRGQG